jgi:hypothetical protein
MLVTVLAVLAVKIGSLIGVIAFVVWIIRRRANDA